ncbi:hypothetical protein NDU88_005524 [Pleurodeles waltl]|uniref:Uncharacterized protein n=1 Tax=Pleurodeles waltl TaxID=8319 RepID=A0AAV7TXH9_PLEWA|nr:hypothetical protein NDU88_005524 [Pleurodeles waltl]
MCREAPASLPGTVVQPRWRIEAARTAVTTRGTQKSSGCGPRVLYQARSRSAEAGIGCMLKTGAEALIVNIREPDSERKKPGGPP